MGHRAGPDLFQLRSTVKRPRSISANLLAGLADLARAGLAGQMEADVWLERAMALARMYASLGMRLCALELCSVY